MHLSLFRVRSRCSLSKTGARQRCCSNQQSCAVSRSCTNRLSFTTVSALLVGVYRGASIGGSEGYAVIKAPHPISVNVRGRPQGSNHTQPIVDFAQVIPFWLELGENLTFSWNNTNNLNSFGTTFPYFGGVYMGPGIRRVRAVRCVRKERGGIGIGLS